MNKGFKGFRDGTHRTIPPLETLGRLESWMGEAGITRVADVTGLDRIGIPVVMVCRPNSRSVAVSQGKGLTLDAARASGLMESFETWHAERITLDLKLGSHADLSRHYRLVDVGSLPRGSESRYHDDLPLLWIEARSLAAGDSLWVPYEMVHTNYTIPRPTGHGCFHASTNGLASGNHFLEAACHAICEVVERDATTLWHQRDDNSRAATRLAPGSVDDANCLAALQILSDADFRVLIWDTTSDVGVPSFYCVIMDEANAEEHPGAGAGCHPMRGIALLRAITEAVQTRTTYIAGSRDDIGPEEYERSGILDKHRAIRSLMNGSAAPRDFREGPDKEFDTFEQDLDWLLEKLSAAGLGPVLAVDLSDAALPIAVVRVVVPGLEAPHDDDDYRPGPRALAILER